MLKPLKSILTYLQKNASGSTIFGITSSVGPSEEPTMEEKILISNEEGACEDPLYDPLALDGCTETDDLNGSIASTTGSDISTGKIILVDMMSLKKPISVDDLSDDAGVLLNESGSSTSTSHYQNGHNDSFTSSEDGAYPCGGGTVHSTATVTTANAVTTDVLTVDDGEEHGRYSMDECNVGDLSATENDSFTTASSGGDDTPDVTTTTVVVNGHSEMLLGVGAMATVECPADVEGQPSQPMEVTPATVESQGEEEEASDGSDSGLGSEPSRNVSTLDLPPVKSSLKRRSKPECSGSQGAADLLEEDGATSQKRIKRGISFDGVTVFYFPRMQGFGCVPSQGGCTLGMEFQHVHSRRFTLAEHAAEQRKVHRQQLQELNPRSSSSEETDSDEEPSESGSEAESESYGFLQPVTTRQRRALLKAAGVRKIDSNEKDECREIRTSREVCGCTCRGYCDPDTCACSQAGIKCQVDRPNFPCGCTQDGCANVVGRVEFNPARVRTHFIHTIMRLNLDKKATREDGRTGTMGLGGSSVGSCYGGNGKDWSSGPIRLPGVYGGVMGGTDSIDGVASMHHHLHHLPHHAQQQQQQQQQTQQLAAHHHHFGSSHTYLSLGASHQMSSLPLGTSAAGESLDLHYAFRDYYGTMPTTSSDQIAMAMSSFYGNYATNLDHYHHPAAPHQASHHVSHHVPHHHLTDQSQSAELHSPYVHQTLDITQVGLEVSCNGGATSSNGTSATVLLDDDVPLDTPVNANFLCGDHDGLGKASLSVEESPTIDDALMDDIHMKNTGDDGTVLLHQKSTPTNDPCKDISNPPSPDATTTTSESDFIDLKTPLADNAERLEAINDLLESSRHAVNASRPLGLLPTGEEELQDFCDPSVLPPVPEAETVVDIGPTSSPAPCCTVDEQQQPEPSDSGGGTDRDDETCRVTATDDESPSATSAVKLMPSGEGSPLPNESTDRDTGTPSTQRITEANVTDPTEECPTVPPVPSPIAVTASATTAAAATIETSENLSEIIKNSIAESVSN